MRFLFDAGKQIFIRSALGKIDAQSEMVEFRSIAAIGAGDASGKQCYVKSKCAQKGSESSVELVTKAATPLAHNFVEEAIIVANDRAAKMDIEILKRHRIHVGAMQRAQSLRRLAQSSRNIRCDRDRKRRSAMSSLPSFSRD